MSVVRYSMNEHKISIKKGLLKRGWLWIGILLACSILYYLEFFGRVVSLGLGAYMTVMILLHFMIGYKRLGSKTQFPTWEFVIFVILFSTVRFLYIYFFLSHHLPEYTLFHYPVRALPATIFGSAALLFLGYSYAIYEWGLAARERYQVKSKSIRTVDQPLILRCEGKTIYVLPQDILYIQANGEYVTYKTGSKNYTCFERLKTVQEKLLTHGFIRTHRSFIVNIDHVQSFKATEIGLSDESIIPVSKSYRESVERKMHSTSDK